MKNFIFILSAILLASCGGDIDEPAGSIHSVGEENDSTCIEDNVSSNEIKPFSNPAYMKGSDFGHMFQSYYRAQNYELMLAFTSSESIELHGEDVLIEHYENMEFGFKLGELKSIQESEDGIITMFYLSNIDATDVRTILHVVVENDSCKMIVHQDIENFPRKTL